METDSEKLQEEGNYGVEVSLDPRAGHKLGVSLEPGARK
jgi:hypothetical protein